MNLSELIKPELILTKTSCASKDELITKLLDKVYDVHQDFSFPKNDVLGFLFNREHIGGTTLPSGLSVPHSRLGDFDGFIFALATPGAPIFHEGVQIRLMALMLSSLTGGPYYLPTVAALTKISMDGEYFQRLSGADNAGDFLSIINEKNLKIA